MHVRMGISIFEVMLKKERKKERKPRCQSDQALFSHILKYPQTSVNLDYVKFHRSSMCKDITLSLKGPVPSITPYTKTRTILEDFCFCICSS